MHFIYEEGRVFIEENGKLLAEITFPIQNGYPCINHTYVNDILRGQGIAGKLMIEAMQIFQRKQQAFHATCTYAIRWLGQHPEYHDLWLH